MRAVVTCSGCREPIPDDGSSSCPECGGRPVGFEMPDPWEVAGGLDLRALEETRAYRQAKALPPETGR